MSAFPLIEMLGVISMTINDEFDIVESGFNNLPALSQPSSVLIEFLGRISLSSYRRGGNSGGEPSSDLEPQPQGPKGGPCLGALQEPRITKPDAPLSVCGVRHNLGHPLDTSNVELTGRGPESWKIKPHYNRAPVERHVRPDIWKFV